MQWLARTINAKLEGYPRYRLSHEMRDGRRLFLQSDPRSPFYFEDSFDARKRIPSLRPYVTDHLEFLENTDAVVFVVDSQLARKDANRSALEKLRTDLGNIGRSDNDVPLVFQCNKRDLAGFPTSQISTWLSWPRAEFVPSIARTGDGVTDAIRHAIALVPPPSVPNLPYR